MTVNSLNGKLHCFAIFLEILDSLRTQTTKTQLIIADTTKGKGFKLFENEPDWHYGVVSDRVMKLISESK